MIYAHIKGDNGEERTEEWEDSRIAADEKRLLIEFDAYAISFHDDVTGQDKTVVVAKYYWDLQGEILPFMEDQPGDYPKMTAFTKETLKSIGGYFRQYLDIEKQVVNQQSIQPEELDAMAQSVTEIIEQNDAMGEQLDTVLGMVGQHTANGQTQNIILPLLKAMQQFTSVFAKSLVAIATLIDGLAKRAEGEDYSPLDYVRDSNVVKQTAEDRRAAEQELTRSRTVFNEHAKQIATSQQAATE